MDTKTTLNKKSDSEVEIEGEIAIEELEKFRAEVVADLGKSVKIDGFREGKVPEKVLKEKIGPMTILQEMAERALSKAYPSIIKEHDLEPIDRPEIAITKLAEGNPLGFKIIQTVMPALELPDYKKIAKETNAKFDKENATVIVTDEELNEIITNIRGSRKKNPKDETEIAPALTDEFVKELGDFENVDDFKTKLRTNMKHEKELKMKDKRRVSIVDAIVAKTKITPPDVMIERQLNQFIAEMKASVSGMGLKFEDYLTQAKKTEDDLRKDARGDAERKVKFSLVLEAIGKAEKIEIDQADIDLEVKKIMEMYKDAKEEGARDYVTGILKNDKVFNLLEEIK